MGTAVALDLAAALCRRFEGLSLVPYLCPAGYWTIGYGTVYKPDGTRITKDHPPITAQTADQWLLHELRTNYMPGVLRASPNLIGYPQALAAMTSFAYNLGVPRYRASTLCAQVRQEHWGNATNEIKKWVRAGGVVLQGLVRRRNAEAGLFAHLVK